MKNKKISIIVVSLNTRIDFIKTIKSIKKQNYNNYEIIVIDGNSTDGTKEEIIKRKEIISKSIIEKDKGIYHAMNKGIKLSNGEWIIFMNSGDVFFRNNILDKFLSEDTNNYDIIYGDTQIINKNLKYIVKSKTFDHSTCLMPFCHQSVFVRSNILKKKNFSLKFKISSDFNFFYHCFISGKKFKKIDFIISKVKPGGLADTNRQQVFSENIKIFYKKKSYLEIVFLVYYKIFEFIKISVKFCLPFKLIKYALKIKYYKL
jgi:glycosyltransferase involved in cell wall biosynthesis